MRDELFRSDAKWLGFAFPLLEGSAVVRIDLFSL